MEIAEILVLDDEGDDQMSRTLLHGNAPMLPREYVIQGADSDNDEDANTSSESDIESNSDYHLIGTEEEFTDFISASQGTVVVTAFEEVEQEGDPQEPAQCNKSCSIPPLSDEKIDLIKRSMQKLNFKPPSAGAVCIADSLLARCKAVRVGGEITTTTNTKITNTKITNDN